MVKEGIVAARNHEAAPEKEVLVKKLKKTTVKPDKAPSKPTPLTPEEIAMFDILEDLLVQIIEDMRDDIREGFAEDMLEQQMSP